MKPLVLLLLSVLAVARARAADPDWAGDPVDQVRASLPPSPTERLYCRPEMIAAFDKAWSLVRGGSAEYEAGFRVDKRDDGSGYDIVFAPMRKDLELKLPIPISATRTIAIAHTHPDDAEPTPGPGDYASPVPNFVISRDALFVTVPGTRRYEWVRTTWSAPCGRG